MANTDKNGKTALSAREQAALEYGGPVSFNIGRQDLDPELKKELDEKGLVARWINYKDYKNGANTHKTGFKAYKIKPDASRGSIDFNYGVSPEGYLIRDDLLLAVKTVEASEAYQAHMRKLNKLNEISDESMGEKLRESARAHGVKAKIHTGYTDNE